ncbi:molybdenum cofactor guanylyltransferase [Candidatus Hakubella thermalkaliphila]|uniref:Probable molybdenum cofactor guanylyltransferase n=1 Tax=Candidatus Hakubella thermalkaliphila TaxID=2754717 RepID=A0A6V8NK58_9ACTN|nr:molybdenum cofactor guanylyltransferase [Candidatus Hakubella thermalkaliphila]GFP18896.1 molybdenum cofactor guanylyltransferase [Candidatus Hakubella thermalkaliphila]GFP31391.1 molybdenum cofactor guanylyltransferase [Candidatus Hakubella thermalkaliphila]GFP39290.1 molybdenum cofactor guanylyltransferase [Candidatus Hakubella thermalkaliphila]
MAKSKRKHQVTGIILAGGSSTRIGKNKAFLQLGSRLVIEHTISRVVEVVDDLLLVANNVEEYRDLRVEPMKLVQDVIPYRGPLGGILSGLEISTTPINLIVACDMPFLNPLLLNFLLRQIHGYDAVIPMTEAGPEPLHAVYTKSCLPAIRESMSQDETRIISFFNQVKIRYVGQENLQIYDPENFSLFNINTLEDLERAREILGRIQEGIP